MERATTHDTSSLISSVICVRLRAKHRSWWGQFALVVALTWTEFGLTKLIDHFAELNEKCVASLSFVKQRPQNVSQSYLFSSNPILLLLYPYWLAQRGEATLHDIYKIIITVNHSKGVTHSISMAVLQSFVVFIWLGLPVDITRDILHE